MEFTYLFCSRCSSNILQIITSNVFKIIYVIPLIVIFFSVLVRLSFWFLRFIGNRSKGIAKIIQGIVKTIIPNHQAPINRGSEGAKGESEIIKSLLKL